MTQTNNSLNIPLADNQVILGKTGLTPIATTLVAGANMTIVPGSGTLTFNSTPPVMPPFTVVNVTSITSQITLERNTFYNVGNGGTPFNQSFALPLSPTAGDMYVVATWPPNGTSTIFINLDPPPSQQLISGSVVNYIMATSIPNQTGFIWLMYVGSSGGFQRFQVLTSNGMTLSA